MKEDKRIIKEESFYQCCNSVTGYCEHAKDKHIHLCIDNKKYICPGRK